jgi:hypothetical protein
VATRWSAVVTEVWCRGGAVWPICVIRFQRLQVWRHLIHLRLTLLQRTPGSFIVVRIVAVVVVRAGGRGVSDFACFGGRHPSRSLCVLLLLTMYSVCVVMLWSWW